MFTIAPLTSFTAEALKSVITGYTTQVKYEVVKTETAESTTITLTLKPLPKAKTIHYSHLDNETVAHYQTLLSEKLSFGAFCNHQLVGVAIASAESWNRSLHIWEFHVQEKYRGQGIGRQLMTAVLAAGASAGLRIAVCETQNWNVPAIAFYRQMGFMLDGVDLSFYSNDDYPNGDIAVFMKRPLSA